MFLSRKKLKKPKSKRKTLQLRVEKIEINLRKK